MSRLLPAGLIVALLQAAPALATQDGYPALYDVTGVAASDVLNIRAAPSAAAPVVGSLPHDEMGVEVTAPDERQRWGRVNTSEGIGWVSLAYLARRPGQWEGAFPEIASCYGTEPFWNLARNGGSLEVSRMGLPEVRVVEAWTSGSASRRDRFALGGSGEGVALTAVIARNLCSDGMSDRLYGLEVELILNLPEGPVQLSGCCSLAR